MYMYMYMHMYMYVYVYMYMSIILGYRADTVEKNMETTMVYWGYIDHGRENGHYSIFALYRDHGK